MLRFTKFIIVSYLIKCFSTWLFSVLLIILTCTAEYSCIVYNLQILIESKFIDIFISIAYWVLPGCSNGHLAQTLEQICKLISNS